MKYFARFLLAAVCAVPFGADCAPVPSTRGNNLTAYNGGSGATNNNNWNSLMNVRSGVDAVDMPVADFGNCNAVILRCAQPKCANGGCTDMDITSTIVAGCVRSNDACAQYGDDLVQYISAQLVAQSTAKANAAQTAAANAVAQQSAQQIQSMQQQMQQIQSQMAAQNAETVAQLQSALEEQKQLTAQAIADATAARTTTVDATSMADTNTTAAQIAAAGALTTAQQIAAQNGVSADILAREQITGQIMSSIENAEAQLKTLKTTMTDVFDYAGCDSKGDNCTGPKRVKVFKQKAMDFFDPYENVLDELYDALIMAQSVGVDITDIYMMLNDSCNVWAQYLCSSRELRDAIVYDEQYNEHKVKINTWPTYTDTTCPNGTSVNINGVRGNRPCVIGQAVPPEDDMSCTLQKTLTSTDEVQRSWLYTENGDMDANIRVGCASSALESSALFRNRKKAAKIDIETLERIIEQDAPSVYGASFGNRGKITTPDPDGIKFCAVNEDTYADLQKIVSLKQLPTKVCVSETELGHELETKGVVSKGNSVDLNKKADCYKTQGAVYSDSLNKCYCLNRDGLLGSGVDTCDPVAGEEAKRKDELVAKCLNRVSITSKNVPNRNYQSYDECTCEEAEETTTYFTNGNTCECGDGETWDNTNFKCK